MTTPPEIWLWEIIDPDGRTVDRGQARMDEHGNLHAPPLIRLEQGHSLRIAPSDSPMYHPPTTDKGTSAQD